MKPKNDASFEDVDALLAYDPLTGAFTWKKSRGGRTAGGVAGSATTRQDGYTMITIRLHGRSYVASRLAWLLMTGEWPPHFIDHKDTDPTNNKFDNLRCATEGQNRANSKKRSDNTSKYKGVSWDPINSKWVARIRVPKGKYSNLGRFCDPEEAHAAYCRAATELHGEFARAG